MKNMVAAALAVLVCGCARDPLPLVRQRAAYDLSCEQPVDVQEMPGNCSFAASGCGKRAIYQIKPVVEGLGPMCCPEPRGCSINLDGQVQQDVAATSSQQ